MKAIMIAEAGPPENLHYVDRESPSPREGDVLIKVHAAGVNRPDILQRLGKYPPPPGASDLPGLEVAGEIIESRHPKWQEGDAVCALLAGGGYAEYVNVPGGLCLPKPDNLTMVEAAALPEAVFTVWNNLFQRGELKKGQRALIHGGASGIGTTAIQMAVAMGAAVAVTAGSAEKCEACRKLGAELAINYREQSFRTAIEQAWGMDSLNVVLDMIGGDYVADNLELLAADGRHVSIAHLGGAQARINVRQVMQKRLVITGSTLRPRPVTEKEKLADGILKTIWPHVKSGHIKPVIFQTFTLKDAAQAHIALDKGDHIGKIVLTV